MMNFPRTSDLSANLLRLLGLGAASIIMLLPVLGMQVSKEVVWETGDFIAMGALLLLLGGALELIARRFTGPVAVKWELAGLAVLAFVTVWGELAVGLID